MVLMTVSEYARLKGVTRALVWTWIRKGALRVRRVAPKTGVRVEVREDEISTVRATRRRRRT